MISLRPLSVVPTQYVQISLFLQRLLHQDQVVHAPPRDRIVECSHIKHTELVTELFRLLLDIKQFFLRMERLNRSN